MRRRLTSNDIQEEEDNMEMAKTTMNRKTAGKSNTVNLVLAALFLALGIILPFFTGQIPTIGSMLLPMHIPVLIRGFVCGWQYGLAVGFIVPLLRSMMFGMPPMPTVAVPMAFELAVYGMMTGLLYKKLPKNTVNIYVSLIGAMIGGRLVWGVIRLLMLGVVQTPFSFSMFIAGAVTTAIPGIILQIILIPLIVIALRKANLME